MKRLSPTWPYCVVAAALAACTSSVDAQAVHWTQRLLSPRSGHAMAHDTARGATVLFGGHGTSSGYLADTWEWNGRAWTRRSSGGPAARAYHAMAYDAARGVTVLFGGLSYGSTYLGDTWEWNGGTWNLRRTQRFSSNPSPRQGHAMAYDAVRGVTVLFGGNNGSYLGDMWEWNGSAWTQRSSSGPPARACHVMAYDAARGVTLLFGGDYSAGPVHFFADTWEWSGSAWTQRSSGGPSARACPAMAYDAGRGVAVLFGGVSYDGALHYLGDTWEWNGSAWTERSSDGPPIRSEAGMTYDAALGTTVLCAGYDGAYLDDTWEWGGSGWTQRSSGGPRARDAPALAYDARRRVSIMFGGDNGGASYGDTWEWNGSAWSQRSLTGPAPRYGCAVACDGARETCVLFGGNDSISHCFADTWEWNGSLWTQRGSIGPSARAYHAMAYDAALGVTVLFGGGYYDGTFHYLGDTWEWNGSAWTQSSSSGPVARAGHAAAYDTARGVVVLFGGVYYDRVWHYLGDTWEWNGSLWTQRSSGGPRSRAGHVMAYDDARGVTVLFGGYYYDNMDQYLGDTWEWNGSTWTQHASAGPSPRDLQGMAFDATRGVTVLFGGSGSNGSLNDTWELGAACGTCSGDINADGYVDGVDVAGWLRCTLAAPQPSDACACVAGMTAAQFVDRLLHSVNTACP